MLGVLHLDCVSTLLLKFKLHIMMRHASSTGASAAVLTYVNAHGFAHAYYGLVGQVSHINQATPHRAINLTFLVNFNANRLHRCCSMSALNSMTSIQHLCGCSVCMTMHNR